MDTELEAETQPTNTLPEVIAMAILIGGVALTVGCVVAAWMMML